MTDSELNNEGKKSVVDDWENVAEEQVIAQVAERQKQIANKQNEEKEARIAADDGHDQLPGPAMSNLDVRNIKLLKRPSSGTYINQMGSEGTKESANGANKSKTLEERQAEYQRARERIFGDLSTSTSAPVDEEVKPDAPVSNTRNQGPNHLSDVPMKTAADSRRAPKASHQAQWSKVSPQSAVPLPSTMYNYGYPTPSTVIPPNTLSYMPPLNMNPIYSQPQGSFVMPVNQPPMMTPGGGYFTQMPNFSHPPPAPGTFPPRPLSAITPSVNQDKLKPLKSGRGGNLSQQKSLRNSNAQNFRPASNINMTEFPSLQQVMTNPPPPIDSSYGRPPPFLFGSGNAVSNGPTSTTHQSPVVQSKNVQP